MNRQGPRHTSTIVLIAAAAIAVAIGLGAFGFGSLPDSGVPSALDAESVDPQPEVDASPTVPSAMPAEIQASAAWDRAARDPSAAQAPSVAIAEADASGHRAATPPSLAEASEAEVSETVPGEVIVNVGSGAAAPRAGDVLAGVTVTGVETLAGDPGQDAVVKLTLDDGARTQEVIDALDAQGTLEAQPNFVYRLLETPAPGSGASGEGAGAEAAQSNGGVAAPQRVTNDARAAEQYSYMPWGNASLSGSQGKAGAGVSAAWDLDRSDGQVTIAVLDTGCWWSHPDLRANIDTAHMKDIYSDSAPGVMVDYQGHGTHVCGIVGAVAENGIGVAGASFNATVLPIKVFDNNAGPNAGASTSDIVKAYTYLDGLVERGELKNLKVVNMSLGYYPSGKPDAALENAINHLTNDHHVLTVCAGGNGDGVSKPYTAPMYPSDYEACLSVTSLAPDGDDSPWSDYNEAKDISAPGEDILSTYGSSGYLELSGTSMASPLVAGIAGLLYSADPTLTPPEVIKTLQDTSHYFRATTTHAKRLNPEATHTGSKGAVDAEAALRYVLEKRLGITQFIEPEDVKIDGNTQIMYSGSEIEPTVTVTHDGQTLHENEDYRVSYVRNIRPGKASVAVEGVNGWGGYVNADFEITIDDDHRTDINEAQITDITTGTYTYRNGDAICPPVTVEYQGRKLVVDEDYTIDYRNNVDAGEGTAEVMVTGIDIYKGTKIQKFTIKPADCYLTIDEKNVYTKVGMDPMEIMIYGPEKMDYQVEHTDSNVAEVKVVKEYANLAKYTRNTIQITPRSKGETTVTLSGSSKNYNPPNAQTFTVHVAGENEAVIPGTQDIANASLSLEGTCVYDGKPQKPKLTVAMGDAILTPGTHYNATYYNNVNAGEATIFVYGNTLGGYSGTTSIHFPIEKAQPTLTLERRALTFTEGAEPVRLGATTTMDAVLEGATSTSDSVARAEVADGSVVVTPIGKGAATITVSTVGSDNLKVATATIDVVVGQKQDLPPVVSDPDEPDPQPPVNPDPDPDPDPDPQPPADPRPQPQPDPDPQPTPTPKPSPGGGSGGGGGGAGGGAPGGNADAPQEPDQPDVPDEPDEPAAPNEPTLSEDVRPVDELANQGAAELNDSEGSLNVTPEVTGEAEVTWTITLQEGAREESASQVGEKVVGSFLRAMAAKPSSVRRISTLTGVGSEVVLEITGRGLSDADIARFAQKLGLTTAQLGGAGTLAAGPSATGEDLVGQSCRVLVTATNGSEIVYTLTFASAGDSEPPASDDPAIDLPDEPAPYEPQTVYRLYNQWTHEHLLTADLGEYDELRGLGWNGEDVAFSVPADSDHPIYRLYNQWNGDHLYTTDPVEYESLQASGWTGEGVKMHGADADGLPIYRLHNPWMTDNAGAFSHLWTADPVEYEANAQLGWTKEGIAWYGLAT